MTCIAITRGGFGTVLRFENDRAAFLHPVTQYGDAIIRSHEDLPDLYNKIEWPKLMRLAGYESRLLEDALLTLGMLEERAARRESSPRIWSLLERLARDPPGDFDGVAAMVAADRVSQDKELRTQMAAETTEGAVTRRTGNLAPDTKIRFGKDAEGKAYGPDNSPYRAESNRAGRFAKLTKNMTVLQAVEAGVAARYIEDMSERGYITLHPKAAAGATEEVEQAAA